MIYTVKYTARPTDNNPLLFTGRGDTNTTVDRQREFHVMAYRSKKDKKKKLDQSTTATSSGDEAMTQEAGTDGTGASRRDPVAPQVVGDQGYPQWANWVYVKWGYLPGVLVFMLFLLLAWPVGLAVAAGILSWIATNFVGSLPESVVNEMGITAPIVMPVVFLVIVTALLSAALVKVATAAGWRYTLRVARGLFAGHGETWKENRRRRKATLSQRRAAVKKGRAEKKEKKAKAKAQVNEAKEKNPEL